MPTVFLTGFPGFLGSAMIPHLLERYPEDTTITCLVQSKFRNMAERRARTIKGEREGWENRIQISEGDITIADLGLGDQYAPLQAETVEVFHFAAVYDLGVTHELGMKVNVEGTKNMLAFAEGCPDLHRFQYVSTCYVSGSHDGIFSEDDLVLGQSFNNYYEGTKYLAEVHVQNAMVEGLPTTIYRPSIVVGDSQTGATQKYDGPYYIIQLLMRQPRVLALLTVLPGSASVEFNIVPSDYVINAMAHLSRLQESEGKVYQLCDPNVGSLDELLKSITEATGRLTVRLPLTKGLAKFAIKHVPGVNWLMKVEAEGIDYFAHPTRYRCPQTLADLEGSGISCPQVSEYVNVLVDFWREHPEFTADAMV